MMSPGSTCIIKGGVYEEQLLVNKDGNAGNYLTFKGRASRLSLKIN